MSLHLWLALVAVLFAMPPAHMALSWCRFDTVALPVVLQGDIQARFAAGELGLNAQLVDLQRPHAFFVPVTRWWQTLHNPGGAQ